MMKIKHYFVKYPNEEDLPFVERLAGRFVGDILLWLGKRQARRQDWHEYNHTVLALVAGNSTSCKGRPDCLAPIERPLGIADARSLILGG